MTLLPNFNKDVHLLEEACGKLVLQPRGSRGEHSAAVGGKWDISNKQRIGFSEVQLVQKMIDGVAKLIAWEERMANGDMEAVKAEIEALECFFYRYYLYTKQDYPKRPSMEIQ